MTENKVQVKYGLYQSVLWRGLFYLSAFAVNIFIARHFEAVISGSLYYVISIYSLVLLFLSLSIESGITFFVSKNEIAAGKLLNFSLLWSLVSGVLGFIFVYYFLNIPFSGFNRQLILISSACFIGGNLLSQRLETGPGAGYSFYHRTFINAGPECF